jgi:hypothetical protein
VICPMHLHRPSSLYKIPHYKNCDNDKRVRAGYRDNLSEAKAQELRFINCSIHGLNEN